MWGVLLGYWGLGGGERDLVVSVVGTVPCPRAAVSELSLVVYVHMSKWVTILMLRICYKYIISNIGVNILNTSML